MEVVLAGDDLGLVRCDTLLLIAPLAGGLDSGLDGLGARVHGQDHVVPGQGAELLGQHRPLVVAEGARGQRKLAGLGDQGVDDAGMVVALVDGRIGAQAVEVLLAVDVPDPDALGLVDDDIQGMVIMGAVLVLDGDDLFAVHRCAPPVESRAPSALFQAPSAAFDRGCYYIMPFFPNRAENPRITWKCAYWSEDSFKPLC